LLSGNFVTSALNIHARNNRTTGLCNPFLSNGSVNTFPRTRTSMQQQKKEVFEVVHAEKLP
jgi:hypothetical protein